ncbi:MAG: hypothetical protein KHY62_02600 [Firmicutes bacterium]|nr:hypothetical protein [Bacillota bacterium]
MKKLCIRIAPELLPINHSRENNKKAACAARIVSTSIRHHKPSLSVFSINVQEKYY